MLQSRRARVFKLIPRWPILYFLPLPPHHRSLLLAVLSRLLPSLRVLQWNAGGLRPRRTELLHFLSSHPVDQSASRNPILTHLPLSGFLDSLLCVLIAPSPGLAFSLLMPRTPAAASSFLSGRAYLFLNFLPPLFSRSIPTLIMDGSPSLLTTPPSCHFLMCMPPYSLLSDGRQNRFLYSSRNLFIPGDFNCHDPLWDSRDTSDLRGGEYLT